MHAMVVLEPDVDLSSVACKRPRSLRWASLILDLDDATVRAGDAIVATSPAEFGLLLLLVTRRTIPMSRDAIMDSVFGPDHGRDPRQADFLVARLRRALAPFGLAQAIGIVPGRGYMLNQGQHLSSPRYDCPALSAA